MKTVWESVKYATKIVTDGTSYTVIKGGKKLGTYASFGQAFIKVSLGGLAYE